MFLVLIISVHISHLRLLNSGRFNLRLNQPSRSPQGANPSFTDTFSEGSRRSFCLMLRLKNRSGRGVLRFVTTFFIMVNYTLRAVLVGRIVGLTLATSHQINHQSLAAVGVPRSRDKGFPYTAIRRILGVRYSALDGEDWLG